MKNLKLILTLAVLGTLIATQVFALNPQPEPPARDFKSKIRVWY